MYYVTWLPGKYVLFKEDSLATALSPVLRVLYGHTDNTKGEFVQLHLSEDEISIIAPQRFQDLFPLQQYTRPYHAMRVDTADPGLNETGILAGITTLFHKYNISILSISTYAYNYILIPIDCKEQFTTMIKSNPNAIIFDDTEFPNKTDSNSE